MWNVDTVSISCHENAAKNYFNTTPDDINVLSIPLKYKFIYAFEEGYNSECSPNQLGFIISI